MKKVSIISVNYNQPQATREFLNSVAELNTYKNLEIIVVDNGSTVNHNLQLAAEFPDVLFIRSEENRGFAGGNNLGLEKSTGDYLFFVNNDTEFTAGLLEKLIAVFGMHPDAGVVSPKILYFNQPEKIQYAGFTEMNFFTGRNACIGEFETDKGQFDLAAHQTAYAHGAAMMVSRTAVDIAGPMPEIFFLYYEELDWCERIKRAGFSIWIEPNAAILHKESVSVGRNSLLKEYYMTRNRILFIRRNASLWQRTVFYLYLILVLVPKNILGHLLHGRFDRIRAFLEAIWWNFGASGKSYN